MLGLLQQRVGEAGLVLVHLLGRELGEHAAQVALQRLLGDPHDLRELLAQEALDGVVQQRILAGQLHVGHPVHVEGDAALGVGSLHLDVDGDVRQLHAVDDLEERHAQRAAAARHAVADLPLAHPAHPAGEDQRLVGSADVKQAAHEAGQDDEDDERGDDEDESDADHRPASFEPSSDRTSTPTARAVSAMTRATAAGKLATKAA